MTDYIDELMQQVTDLEADLYAIRRALNAADDSNLASLAETMMAQRRLLAEYIAGDTLWDKGVQARKLARSIVNDEPAPAVEEAKRDVGPFPADIAAHDEDELNAALRYCNECDYVVEILANDAGWGHPCAEIENGRCESYLYPIAPHPAPAGDERREVGEALIAWAGQRDNSYACESYTVPYCQFCGRLEYTGHKDDCLHLRARQLQERE